MVDVGKLNKELEDAEERLALQEDFLKRYNRQGDIELHDLTLEKIKQINQEITAIKNEIEEASLGDKAKNIASNVAGATAGAAVKTTGFLSKLIPSKSSSKGSSGSSSNSSPNSSSKKPPRFIFLLLLAIFTDFFRWYTNYQIGWLYLVLSFFTFFVFIGYGYKGGKLMWVLLILFCDLFLASILTSAGVSSTVIAWFVFFPWWTAFALYANFDLGMNSTFGYVVLGVVFISLLFILNPAILTNSLAVYANQQGHIHDVADFFSQQWSTFTATTSGLWTQIMCEISNLGGIGNNVDCSKISLTPQQQLAAQLASETVTTNTGFNVQIGQFTLDTDTSNAGASTLPTLLSDQTSVMISADNYMATPVTLQFICGLTGRGNGVPDPDHISVAPGVLSPDQSVINCMNLDVSKKGTSTFYFNVTAVNVVSHSQRSIIVIGSNALSALIAKTQGTTQQDKLLNTKIIGDLVKADPNALKTQIGQNDLIQPIIKTGGTVNIQQQSPIAYGISQGSNISFALFIKNNAKGTISSISNILFTIPPLFSFGPENLNCGVNNAFLTRTSWSSIRYGQYSPQTNTCRLVANNDLQTPNNPQELTLDADVTYNYIVSDSRDVYIPGQQSILGNGAQTTGGS